MCLLLQPAKTFGKRTKSDFLLKLATEFERGRRYTHRQQACTEKTRRYLLRIHTARPSRHLWAGGSADFAILRRVVDVVGEMSARWPVVAGAVIGATGRLAILFRVLRVVPGHNFALTLNSVGAQALSKLVLLCKSGSRVSG